MRKAILCFAFLFAVPAFAQTTTSQDLKEVDEFFATPIYRKLSGCNSSVWEDIHRIVHADLARQALPDSDADYGRLHELEECSHSVNQEETKNWEGFYTVFHDNRRADTEAQLYFEWYYETVLAHRFVTEAVSSYQDHIDDVHHRELVTRYNALVDRYNARVSESNYQRPTHLHCESRTDFLGKTTTDCQ